MNAGPVPLPRQVPTALSALFPPAEGYAYFEQAALCRFIRTPDYQRGTAWWCAETSLAAYLPDQEAIETLQRGFAPLGVESVQCGSTRALGGNWFLLHCRDLKLLVFRGGGLVSTAERSRLWIEGPIQDWLFTDAAAMLSRYEHGGRVHTGFRSAYQEMRDEVRAALAVDDGDKPLWLTGHSLGGALALLTAADCHCGAVAEVEGVYVFGAPRVGNAAFMKLFAGVPLHHVVNDLDLVARVPPRHVLWLPYLDRYAEIRETRFIGRQGGVETRGGWRSDYLDLLPGAFPAAFGQLWLGPDGWWQAAVPAMIRDHAPVLYTTHLWNDWVASLG
ncbi:lipase family protein [Chitinimonas lacunae]|uniref:Fungal lipase-type domain-containing protein n=1 Tax=Chitinimonas lacunae TaxID=1963018 RepID=A0ABV8MKJ7_9NEIS